MTSSTSCSSRTATVAAAVALAATLGCAQRPKGAPALRYEGERPRIALLPPQNLTGGPIPAREVLGAVEAALAREGLDIVSGAPIEEFLAKHRFRYIGGVSPEMARAAREDVGADAILVTSVELYGRGPPTGVALNLRLVATDDQATLLWIDGEARRGDDSPGILGLGIVGDLGKLRSRALARLARSLAAFAGGRGEPAGRCPGPARFAPDIFFRSPQLDRDQTYTVAVLPFLDETRRRGAADIVALEVVRQLQAEQAFEVLEPGVVREQLLRARIVLEGGISLDGARALRGTLTADLVVTGSVRDYEEPGQGFPRATFSVVVLDSRTSRVVWHSTSQSGGKDGVFFFDAGTIHTAPALVCRMARPLAQGLASGKATRERRGAAGGEE